MVYDKEAGMILNEKMLEDYFAGHIDDVIEKLKESFDISHPVTYIGRQVNIGSENRLDMLFYYDAEETDDESSEPFTSRKYIVLELKFRGLCTKDLIQLSRYMDAVATAPLYKHHDFSKWSVNGILAGAYIEPEFAKVYAHVIDENSTRIWVVQDNMEILITDGMLFAMRTELCPDEIDSRFSDGMHVTDKDYKE